MKAMGLSRRDFMQASSAIGAAFGLGVAGVTQFVPKAEAKETSAGGLPVLWLQAQACTGCSVSLLNSIYYATITDLAVNTLDINFHSNLSAAAGNQAVSAIEKTYRQGGYALVVEGAVPTAANGNYCTLWPGLTALKGVQRYAERASVIIAAGTCASFGGLSAAQPNVTGAKSVSQALGGGFTVVNIPGCPMHPDWLVGTVAYILANGSLPALDALGRPTAFYGKTLHEQCPYLGEYNTKYGRQSHARGQSCLECHTRTDSDVPQPRSLGTSGCLFALGCKGLQTRCDCAVRKWNGGAAGTPGVSWCVEAGGPCTGCTEPTFPDGMSPFNTLNGPGADD
jgi:NiFe hydrogenase small subunit HydA